MAMEPTSLYDDMEGFNVPFLLQLVNLGRIIENPSLISAFAARDFMDASIHELIRVLKSDKPKEAKNLHLKTFFRRMGCSDWGPESSGSRKELFEAQRRQVAMNCIANQAVLMIEDLQRVGHVTNKSGMTKSLEDLKELIEDCP